MLIPARFTEALRYNTCMSAPADEFYRISKLPPYVFAVVNEMKARLRADQQDVVDLGMGNPDGPTPRPIVNKMIEAVQKSAQSPLFAVQRHSTITRRDRPPVQDEVWSGPRSGDGSDRHHRREGRAGAPAFRGHRSRRCRSFPESGLSDPSVRRRHGGGACLHAADAESARRF